jgi:uncharacterized damage-inducible protein DinB
MKKLLAVWLLGSALPGATLTQEERDFAVRHLEQSRKAFLTAIEGLTPAQWTFKPAPGGWSVGEAAEHVAVAEFMLLEFVQKKLLLTPVDAALAEKARGNDEKVIARQLDRSQKVKTAEFLEPRSRWSQQNLADEFHRRRNATLAFVRTTQEDLRAHARPDPNLGAVDCYQTVLAISAHTLRHTAQIAEVKAHPGYPKGNSSTGRP